MNKVLSIVKNKKFIIPVAVVVVAAVAIETGGRIRARKQLNEARRIAEESAE